MTRHQPRAGPSMAIHSSPARKGFLSFFLVPFFILFFYFRDVVVSDLDNAPPPPLPLQTFFVWDLHLHGDADIIIQFSVCLPAMACDSRPFLG